MYAFLCTRLFSAEIVILDDYKKIWFGIKISKCGEKLFFGYALFGRSQKFESPISRLRKVVEGFLKKQNVFNDISNILLPYDFCSTTFSF